MEVQIMELYEIVVKVLAGLVVIIPLVAELVKYVKKAGKEKNWTDLMTLVISLMKQAEDMFLRLVKEYADRQDVTEQLKKDNPYEWIGRMNNIQACVREVVGTELIYT